MPVSIQIRGNSETNEFKDALFLKQIFEKEFKTSQVNGEILIISSATLFGQEVKDIDLIVLGNFENYSCRIKTKSETGSYPNRLELEMKERLVYFNSFCFVIETKRHIAEDIQLNGVQLLVKYNNKLHDVTSQSEKQKYSLTSYISDRLNFSPYVCNFIWFRNISWDSIKQLLGPNENVLTKHNYLPNTFGLPFLLQLACVQSVPYTQSDSNGKVKSYSSFSCLKRKGSFDMQEMASILSLFNKIKEGVGQMSRKKVEIITSRLLDNQQYAKAIGEKFVIISGRAGTGKTIKLLRIACDIAISQGARCLILTYNHALVSDIKRTIALAEIPDGVDTYTVQISTLHKFFYELLLGFGLVRDEDSGSVKKYIPEYLSKYEHYLKELHEYIDSGIIQDKEIQELMHSRHELVAWDYILVDEAQDWGDFEKSIIFRIFGPKHVIIADGVDQLVRTQKKCNWVSGMKPDEYRKTHEKKGLRQKVNLVNFINDYAKQLGIVWELEPKQELIGGKVIISLKDYSSELHNVEVKKCKESGNVEYEMMYLVPPSMVAVARQGNKELRSFKYAELYKQMGISIWDSTSKDLRSDYPVDLTQHRLLQYESCRGLEGWTVVCLQLDEFIEYKMRTFKDEDTNELALETFDERRFKFVHLWSLIPLTRAIDTLIITLKNKDSQIAAVLRKVYMNNSDFIRWIE